MSEGTREGYELLLAGGERGAAFEDGFRELAGKGADEVGEVDLFGGVFDFSVSDMGAAEADVLRDGAGEEEAVLRHDTEAAAKQVEVLIADIDAVDEHGAGLDIVKAHHERGDGGLAGAGVADDGGGLVGRDGEGDAAENPFDIRKIARGIGG